MEKDFIKGVPQGQKKTPAKPAKAPGKEGQRARFAETLKSFKKAPSLDGMREIAKFKK